MLYFYRNLTYHKLIFPKNPIILVISDTRLDERQGGIDMNYKSIDLKDCITVDKIFTIHYFEYMSVT